MDCISRVTIVRMRHLHDEDRIVHVKYDSGRDDNRKKKFRTVKIPYRVGALLDVCAAHIGLWHTTAM